MAQKEMVEFNSFAAHLRKSLEKLLLRLNNFELDGTDYDLILLIPLDRYAIHPEYRLVLSASVFSAFASQRDRIMEVLTHCKKTLRPAECSAIDTITILSTDHPFVQSMRQRPAQGPLVAELEHINIIGTHVEYAIMLRSGILSSLVHGHAVQAVLFRQDLKQQAFGEQIIGMGLERLEQNFELVFYTGRGLKEIFPQSNGHREEAEKLRNLPEDVLLEQGYMDKIDFDKIHRFVYDSFYE